MATSLLSAAGMKSWQKDFTSAANLFAKQQAEDEERRKKYLEDAQEKQAAINNGIENGTLNPDGSVKQKKNAIESIQDFFGDVGKTVDTGVKGIAGSVADTAKLAYDTITTANASEARSQTGKEILKQSKEINDAAERGDITWDEAKEQTEKLRNSSLAKANKAAQETEAKGEESTAKTAKSFENNAVDAYKLAQYIPGVATGVESLGTTAAKLSGDDSDANKRLIKLTQGLDWGSLSDDEKKQALAARDTGAALSLLDVVPGLGYGGKVGKTAISQLTKVGAKEIAGQALKGAAVGTAGGAALGEGIAALNGSDIKEGILQGAQAGLIGGALGAPFDAAASVKANAKTSLEKAMQKGLKKTIGTDEDVATAAANIVKNLPEGTDNNIVDQITAIRDSSKNVNDLRSGLADIINKQKSSAKSITGTTVSNVVSGETGRLDADVRSLDENAADIQRLNNGEDESVFKYTTEDGQDVTSTARAYENQIGEKDAQIQELTTQRDQLERQANGINENTGSVEPEIDGSSARATAAQAVDKLDSKIAELQTQKNAIQDEQTKAFERYGSVSKVVDSKLAKEKMQTLNKERMDIEKYNVQNDANLTAANIQNDINAIDNGKVPSRFLKVNEPAATVQEAVYRAMKVDPGDQTGVQRSFATTNELRQDAQGALDNLYTQDKYFQDIAALDQQYNKKAEALKGAAEPRRKYETALMDEEYAKQYSAAQDKLDADAGRVEELQQALSVADDIDARTVDQWNSMEQSNPEAFADVDTEALDAYREILTREKAARELRGDTPLSPEEVSDNVTAATMDAGSAKAVDERLSKDPDLDKTARASMADGLRHTNKSVTGVAYALGIPRNVLEGMGEAGTKINSIMSDAINKIDQFNGKLRQTVIDDNWNVVFKKKYQDQTVDFLNEGSTLSRMSGETGAHFERRVKASNSMKKWLRDTGEKLGISKEQLEGNYLPHLVKNLDEKAEALAQLSNGIDMNGKPLTSEQTTALKKSVAGITPGMKQVIERANIYNVENGFLKKRTGADGWERDLPTVLDAYRRAAEDTLYKEPALLDMKEIGSRLNKDQRKYVDSVADEWNRGDPSTRIGRALSNARRIQNVALMGASARTAAMQYFALVNVYSNAHGFGGSSLFNTITATRDILNPRSPFMREMREMGVFENSLANTLIGSGSFSKGVSKVERNFYRLMSGADIHTRAIAYKQGKYEYAKSIGKSVDSLTASEEAAARLAGKEFSDKTIFTVDARTTPLKQGTELGKMVTQLQQFNIQQLDFNSKIFFGKNNESMFVKDPSTGAVHFSKRGAARATRALIGYGAAMALVTSAGTEILGEDVTNKTNIIGLDWKDVFPFGEQITSAYEIAFGDKELSDFEVPTSPLFSLMFGSKYGDGIVDYISAANQYRKGAIDKDEYDETMSNLLPTLIKNVLPGGTQAMRTAQGAEFLMNGESKTSDGSTRFLKENNSGWNIMKGLIGGQYATDEGQKWIRQGLNTISKNMTVEMADGSKVPASEYARTLTPEAQAQYIGYFSSKAIANKELERVGLSKSAVKDNIVTRLKAQQINLAQAEREVEEWNDKYRLLMNDYISNNASNMPLKLQNDFTDNTLMSLGKRLTQTYN